MTIYTCYESVLAMIEDHYPPAQYPAENAFLLERYAFQPELTLAMEEATALCLAFITRIEASNPRLSESESEAAGFQRFGEELAKKLHSEAQGVFGET